MKTLKISALLRNNWETRHGKLPVKWPCVCVLTGGCAPSQSFCFWTSKICSQRRSKVASQRSRTISRHMPCTRQIVSILAWIVTYLLFVAVNTNLFRTKNIRWYPVCKRFVGEVKCIARFYGPKKFIMYWMRPGIYLGPSGNHKYTSWSTLGSNSKDYNNAVIFVSFFHAGHIRSNKHKAAWCLQCFDAVGWVAGRSSGLWKLSGEVLAYLSGVRCKWFSYGSADGMPLPPHYLFCH